MRPSSDDRSQAAHRLRPFAGLRPQSRSSSPCAGVGTRVAAVPRLATGCGRFPGLLSAESPRSSFSPMTASPPLFADRHCQAGADISRLRLGLSRRPSRDERQNRVSCFSGGSSPPPAIIRRSYIRAVIARGGAPCGRQRLQVMDVLAAGILVLWMNRHERGLQKRAWGTFMNR